MAFSFESSGRNWAISLTDLVLSVAALAASYHAAGGKVSLDFHSSEGNLVGLAFMTLALCAFLGFLRWGFLPGNRPLNRVYGHLIEVTKFASLPFLILNLIKQHYVPTATLFLTLHLIYVITVFIALDHKRGDEISQALTVVPLVLLAVQAFLDADVLRGAVVGGFLLVPLVMKKRGIPDFHILMAVLCWVLESARVGYYARFPLPRVYF